MSIEKLNRAARAAGCAMAPPEELFDEPKAEKSTGGWAPARHEHKSVDRQQSARTSWREMFAGWTHKAPA